MTNERERELKQRRNTKNAKNENLSTPAASAKTPPRRRSSGVREVADLYLDFGSVLVAAGCRSRRLYHLVGYFTNDGAVAMHRFFVGGRGSRTSSKMSSGIECQDKNLDGKEDDKNESIVRYHHFYICCFHLCDGVKRKEREEREKERISESSSSNSNSVSTFTSTSNSTCAAASAPTSAPTTTSTSAATSAAAVSNERSERSEREHIEIIERIERLCEGENVENGIAPELVAYNDTLPGEYPPGYIEAHTIDQSKVRALAIAHTQPYLDEGYDTSGMCGAGGQYGGEEGRLSLGAIETEHDRQMLEDLYY
ncbi:hypothetical protein C8J55DRAFT_486004 [Lentinula edodes]|uniref:Uncharacterized protein n=1 Tax=Lentinula lateritia TaxID=40482 RepID=A0A9W9DYM6_9AGAR|nr:hypothetical protein C8J55DRAFT_486004 [Lentinula edodes]